VAGTARGAWPRATLLADPNTSFLDLTTPSKTPPPNTHTHPGKRTPVSYAQLRDYFRSDPAISWGGYVAGCLLVLAREKGVGFPDGISMLICSDVPEGAFRRELRGRTPGGANFGVDLKRLS
jgi:hypothetical protein